MNLVIKRKTHGLKLNCFFWDEMIKILYFPRLLMEHTYLCYFLALHLFMSSSVHSQYCHVDIVDDKCTVGLLAALIVGICMC